MNGSGKTSTIHVDQEVEVYEYQAESSLEFVAMMVFTVSRPTVETTVTVNSYIRWFARRNRPYSLYIDVSEVKSAGIDVMQKQSELARDIQADPSLTQANRVAIYTSRLARVFVQPLLALTGQNARVFDDDREAWAYVTDAINDKNIK